MESGGFYGSDSANVGLTEEEIEMNELKRCLRKALEHQVSNLGSTHEFYTCYTYPNGEMPEWVSDAKKLLRLTK